VFKKIAQKPRAFTSVVQQRLQQRSKYLSLKGFPKGLNTYNPRSLLDPQELSECINFYIGVSGSLVPREGLHKFTQTTFASNPYDLVPFVINNKEITLISTVNGELYQVDNLGVVTLLFSSLGKAQLKPFNDLCLICDGSYIKVLDQDGNLSLAYDSGDLNNLLTTYDEPVESTGQKMFSGQSLAGVEFTYPAFTSNLKVPFTWAEFTLKKVGTPTGDIKVKLYKGTVLLSTSSTIYKAEDLLITNLKYLFNFNIDSSDQSTWLESGVSYKCVIEFTGGDSSNYVEMALVTVSTDGVYYDSSWHTGQKSPLINIAPNLPPKSDFCEIKSRRPFFNDVTNGSKLWFGNLSPYDFSTENGGGFIDVTDTSRNDFIISGLRVFFNALYIFGSQRNPVCYKLIGESPMAFSIQSSLKEAYAKNRCITNSFNDLWLANKDGVHSIQGVQAYGDLRLQSQAKSIYDKFTDWDDSKNNFLAFNAEKAVMFLHKEGQNTIQVCNLNFVYRQENGTISFPWSVFEFEYEPVLYKKGQSHSFLGLKDNNLYYFDMAYFEDYNSTEINYKWATAFLVFPFRYVDIDFVEFFLGSKQGLTVDVEIYTQLDLSNPVYSQSIYLGIQNALVKNATSLVKDANFLVDSKLVQPVYLYNLRCASFLLKVTSCKQLGQGLTSIQGLVIQYKTLEE